MRPAHLAALRLLFPAMCLPILASCGPLIPTVCTQELGVELSPGDRTLRVGEAFTATATGVSCGGRERFPHTVRWASTAPEVASVDSITGRVLAVSAGTAHIQAREPGSTAGYWGEIVVSVAP